MVSQLTIYQDEGQWHIATIPGGRHLATYPTEGEAYAAWPAFRAGWEARGKEQK